MSKLGRLASDQPGDITEQICGPNDGLSATAATMLQQLYKYHRAPEFTVPVAAGVPPAVEGGILPPGVLAPPFQFITTPSTDQPRSVPSVELIAGPVWSVPPSENEQLTSTLSIESRPRIIPNSASARSEGRVPASPHSSTPSQ